MHIVNKNLIIWDNPFRCLWNGSHFHNLPKKPNRIPMRRNRNINFLFLHLLQIRNKTPNSFFHIGKTLAPRRSNVEAAMNFVKFFLPKFSNKGFVQFPVEGSIIPFNHSVIANQFLALWMKFQNLFQRLLRPFQSRVKRNIEFLSFQLPRQNFRLIFPKFRQRRIKPTRKPPVPIKRRLPVSKQINLQLLFH